MEDYKVEFILTAKIDGEEVYKRTNEIADEGVIISCLKDALRAVTKEIDKMEERKNAIREEDLKSEAEKDFDEAKKEFEDEMMGSVGTPFGGN